MWHLLKMFLVNPGLENNFKSYKLLKYPKAENSVILIFFCIETQTEQPRKKVYMILLTRFESQGAL